MDQESSETQLFFFTSLDVYFWTCSLVESIYIYTFFLDFHNMGFSSDFSYHLRYLVAEFGPIHSKREAMSSYPWQAAAERGDPRWRHFGGEKTRCQKGKANGKLVVTTWENIRLIYSVAICTNTYRYNMCYVYVYVHVYYMYTYIVRIFGFEQHVRTLTRVPCQRFFSPNFGIPSYSTNIGFVRIGHCQVHIY